MTGLSFDERVAIITGAGNGVGRSHALDLARRGAAVVVNDIGAAVDGTDPSAGPAQAVVDEIRAAGGDAIANTDSVATPEGGAAIVDAAVRAFGRVDIVINNAGILRDSSFAKLTFEDLEAVLDVHLRGAFHVSRPAWVLMREQGYGRIVNTTSGSGLFGNFGQTAYGAAKMGLVGMTRVMAVEGAKANIKVNAIAPIALTRMTDPYLDKSKPMLPEMITPIVAYLSHESCSVTGQMYHVGGGKVARAFIGVTDGIESSDLTAEMVAESIGVIDDTSCFTVR